MNDFANIRRFAVAGCVRPPARVFRLPVRSATRAVTQPLLMRWSSDPASGRPVARWIHELDGACPAEVPQRRASTLLDRLAA